MTTEVAGRLELCDIGGNGIGDFDCLKQMDVHGRVERDEYVYLRRTALGLRLQPLNTDGPLPAGRRAGDAVSSAGGSRPVRCAINWRRYDVAVW